jgi:hypothetical protein
MAVPRVGDLEVDQNLEFEKVFWRAQRIGWGVVALVVLAALLGVFGNGSLGWTATRDGGRQRKGAYPGREGIAGARSAGLAGSAGRRERGGGAGRRRPGPWRRSAKKPGQDRPRPVARLPGIVCAAEGRLPTKASHILGPLGPLGPQPLGHKVRSWRDNASGTLVFPRPGAT